ncbi:MAG: hypothetical protein ACRD99_04325 [Nitrososphaera sp.]
MSRGTWIIALSILTAAGIFAAAAAYGSQTPGQQAGFDSDLPSFLKRSDSSLLKIVRHDDSGGESQRLDEYSFATAYPAIYKYLSSVDKAHKLRVAADAELQPAYIEVVLSKSETRTVLKEIGLKPQATQENSYYEIHVLEIEVSGRYYALELFAPK